MAEELPGPIPDAALADSVLFRGFDAAQRAALAVRFKLWKYNQGEAVYRKGSSDTHLYVIIKGLVTVRDPGPARGAGREVQVLRAGGIFGEIAFIDSGPRPLDAICGTTTSVAALSQESFYTLVAEDPLIGAGLLHNLASVLCKSLRRANDELMEASNRLSLAAPEAEAEAENLGGGLYRRLRGSMR